VALFKTRTVSAEGPGVLAVWAVWAISAGAKKEASSAEMAARERSFVDGRDIK
jgi:hypothetical protein